MPSNDGMRNAMVVCLTAQSAGIKKQNLPKRGAKTKKTRKGKKKREADGKGKKKKGNNREMGLVHDPAESLPIIGCPFGTTLPSHP